MHGRLMTIALDNVPQGRLDGQDAAQEGTQDFNYNGSQFYICVADNSGLDRTYTVFGEVFRGMEVADKIVAVARGDYDNPLKPITMKLTIKE
jgi:peptidyl-prolyl cis-trans isomerase B (cyclophilin B)